MQLHETQGQRAVSLWDTLGGSLGREDIPRLSAGEMTTHPAGLAFADLVAEAEKQTDIFQTELNAVNRSRGFWHVGGSIEGAAEEGGSKGLL